MKTIYCITLDSFNTNIPFSITEFELMQILTKRNIPFDMTSEFGFTVKSKLFMLDIDFRLSFYFNNRVLTEIVVSPITIIDDEELKNRYSIIQKALENEFGKPHNVFLNFVNMLDPENKTIYWTNKKLKIEHSLFNRFGIEEIIDFKLK